MQSIILKGKQFPFHMFTRNVRGITEKCMYIYACTCVHVQYITHKIYNYVL